MIQICTAFKSLGLYHMHKKSLLNNSVGFAIYLINPLSGHVISNQDFESTQSCYQLQTVELGIPSC